MLHDARLYAILDLGYVPQHEVTAVAERLAGCGAGIVQLRAKGFHEAEVEALALEVLPVFRKAGVPLVINDFPEVAGRVDADGFHLGQDDGTLEESIACYAGARHPTMPERIPIVGRSTHSVAQAVAAEAEGFDYIGFGPLFATPTKPGRPGIGIEKIEAVHRLVALPIFCIGGIKAENLAEVVAAGARRVVIVSGLLEAGEEVAEKASEVLQVLAISEAAE